MAFLPASSPPLPSFSCPSPFSPLLSPLAEGVPLQVFKCPAVCGQHPGPAYSGDTPPPATWGSRCPTAPSWPLGPSHWLHCHLMSLNALSPHKTTRPANPFHKTKLEAERGSWVAGPVTSVPTPMGGHEGELPSGEPPTLWRREGARGRGSGGSRSQARWPQLSKHFSSSHKTATSHSDPQPQDLWGLQSKTYKRAASPYSTLRARARRPAAQLTEKGRCRWVARRPGGEAHREGPP